MGHRHHLAISNVTDGETEAAKICRRTRGELAAGLKGKLLSLGKLSQSGG